MINPQTVITLVVMMQYCLPFDKLSTEYSQEMCPPSIISYHTNCNNIDCQNISCYWQHTEGHRFHFRHTTTSLSRKFKTEGHRPRFLFYYRFLCVIIVWLYEIGQAGHCQDGRHPYQSCLQLILEQPDERQNLLRFQFTVSQFHSFNDTHKDFVSQIVSQLFPESVPQFVALPPSETCFCPTEWAT